MTPDGGNVILMDSGRYEVTGTETRGTPVEHNDRWITVRPSSDLNQEDVVISQPAPRSSVRPFVNRIRWYGLSFDFSTIIQYYNNPGQPVWFDSVYWYDSNGWSQVYSPAMPPVRADRGAGVYVTESSIENMVYGYVNCSLVRNCTMRFISGDALQNSQFVINCVVATMRQVIPELHMDVLQMWGGHENTIAYGIDAVDLEHTQGLFLQSGNGWVGDGPRFLDCAYVDVILRPNISGAPEASQLEGPFRHVYFNSIDFGGQKLFLRTDFTNHADIYKWPFSAENVLFESCTFYLPIPPVIGVTIVE